MTICTRLLALSLCLIIASTAVHAIEVQVGESGSALLSPRSYADWLLTAGDSNWTTWAESNRNGGNATDNRYMPKNRGSYAVSGIILWYFDLSAQSGMTATADAQVSDNVLWGWTGSETYRIYQILSNWNESTVTWSNWFGMGIAGSGNKAYTNWFGPELDFDTVAGTVKSTWTITSSVVQTWLDNPGEFKGLAIVPDVDGARYFFSRQATWKPITDRPLLVIQVQSSNPKPNTPTNTVPANNAIAVVLTPTLTATPFSDPSGDGHAASQFQVAADPGFVSPAFDSGATNALTSINVPAGRLGYGTRYYWRVRYKDNNASPEWSSWSPVTSFITAINVVEPIVRYATRNAMIVRDYPNTNITPANAVYFLTDGSYSNTIPPRILMHWFDLEALSVYTGLVVEADGDMAANVSWTWQVSPPSFAAYPLVTPWTQTGATWNTVVGPNHSAWTNIIGPIVDMADVPDTGLVHWTSIDKELLQQWIEDPSTNNGLALVRSAQGSAQFWATPWPRLTFYVSYTNAATPNTPTNVLPANGAVEQPLVVTLTSTPFSGAGIHSASQWQIGEDATLASPLWDSGSATGALLAITVPSNTLKYSSRYYWHVRHINEQGGKSEWSSPTSFDTMLQMGPVLKKAARTSMINYVQPTSNVNGMVANQFLPIGPSSNGVNGAVMLFWFDLGVLQGAEVDGDATFRVNYGWVDVNFGDINFRCYRVIQPWSETGVTWNSFVGMGETNYGAAFGDYFGLGLAMNNESSLWTISHATIQEWVNSGASNFGLALYPDMNVPNAFIYTRKSPGVAPTLGFSIIPEPAALLVIAAMLPFVRRRA